MTPVAAADPVGGHVRRTLRELAQLDGLSAAIGGIVVPSGDSLVLSELHNLRCELLRGVRIRPGIGLGGLAMQRRRPVAVENYVQSQTITHQFDNAVLADRIRSAIALPVLVRGRPRAVIYGATRGDMTFGDRTVGTATVLARKLAHDIEVEETVQQRLKALHEEDVHRSERMAFSVDEMADVNAELAAIAAATQDHGLRERILHLSKRLASGGGAGAATAPAMAGLSRRESDVLLQLAAGYTNAEIAERLCILPTTVKTHLRHTMRKLGARNRVETVATARHLGLLP